MLRVGAGDEPRMAGQHRGPRLPTMIDAADQQKRKLREKFAMLVRHEIAYHTPAYHLHFFLHSRSRLRSALAAMKRGCLEGRIGKVRLGHGVGGTVCEPND